MIDKSVPLGVVIHEVDKLEVAEINEGQVLTCHKRSSIPHVVGKYLANNIYLLHKFLRLSLLKMLTYLIV